MKNFTAQEAKELVEKSNPNSFEYIMGFIYGEIKKEAARGNSKIQLNLTQTQHNNQIIKELKSNGYNVKLETISNYREESIELIQISW